MKKFYVNCFVHMGLKVNEVIGPFSKEDMKKRELEEMIRFGFRGDELQKKMPDTSLTLRSEW